MLRRNTPDMKREGNMDKQSVNKLDFAGGRLVRRMFLGALLVQIISAITGVIGMVVDGAVIGSMLGSESMTAYGLVTPITTVFAALAGIVGVGTSTLCGRFIGRGDVRRTEAALGTSVLLSAVVSLVIAGVVYFASGPIASALGAEGEVHTHAAAYLRGFAFCAPPLFLVMVFMPIVQLDNDGKRVFLSILAMTAVNVALDFVSALALDWGMLGMALATTISYYVAFVLMLCHFVGGHHSLRLTLRGWQPKLIRDIFVLGMPMGFSMLTRTIFVVLFNAILLSLADNSAVAVFAMLNSGGAVFLTVGQGIGSANQMITSVLAGEEDVLSLEQLMKTSLRVSLIGNGILTLIALVVAAPYSALFFSGSEAELALAARALRMYVLQTVPYACSICFSSYLQGMKRYVIAYPLAFVSQLVISPLVALALGHLFGTDGVWLSFVVGSLLSLVVVAGIVWVRSGKLRFSIRDLLLLPKGFGVPEEDRLDGSISGAEQIVSFSEAAVAFCREKGAAPRTAMLVGLFVEEMAYNIVEHGFTGAKAQSVDIRLSRLGDGWRIRIKDACREFDPVAYAELFHPEDPLAHVGIRLVSAMSTDMEYVRSLSMNNLILTL